MPDVPVPRLIDVSHTVESGLTTYKGLPAPIVCDFLSREESRQHLTNLAALPETKIRFFAVPVKVKAFGTFPVRAFAKVEDA